MRVCVNTFTTSVVYSLFGGADLELNGVFNDPYQEGIALDGAPFQTRLYRLGIHRDDLPRKPGNKDTVEITGSLNGRYDGNYEVHDIEPDGDAGYVLLLHKAGS